MVVLKYLTESFTDRLKSSIGEHLERYKTENPWVKEFAGGRKWERESKVEIQLARYKSIDELMMDPSKDNLMDLENSKRLFQALRVLTPTQARHPGLWTRLTHVEFWAYMRKRWPIEKHIKEQEKAERYIESHYFVTGSSSRHLLRNGLARLWWYSYLTYDEGRDNPFELTEVVLKNLDITQGILERNLGRSKTILTGFLEFLCENPELLLGGKKNRELIRDLVIFLNSYGGVAVLDCLSKISIKSQLTKKLDRFLSQREEDFQDQDSDEELVLIGEDSF